DFAAHLYAARLDDVFLRDRKNLALKNDRTLLHQFEMLPSLPHMTPIVQISLDLTNISEALETAHTAVRAGVDWLEAGTPLLLAEGLNAVAALRREFPKHPIVADLKTMDGGWLEAE